ncbi:MAG: polyprenol monophosphomannose synthase [Bacillota bacterium]
MSTPQVTVILPTLNEGENLPLILPRIAAALADRPYEVLVIDDGSRDNTPEVCDRLSQQYPLKLIVRTHPANGLSGAVLHGIAQAQGEYLVVMDADLQHPPEKLPDLLAPLQSDQADFVLGSRYVPGGEMADRFTLPRRLLSRLATLFARPIIGHVHDPMSGFFAIRRSSYLGAQRLTPLGYKIGLELLCKCPLRAVREIPIFFGARLHGQSKLTFREQFRYMEHLSRLYDFCYPRVSPIAKFLIALGCSWVGAAILFVLLLLAGVGAASAAIASYPLALLITALFHLRYCRTQREFILRAHPWRDFLLISLAEWVACALSALWLASRLLQPRAGEIFLLSFSFATVIRYVLRKELLLDIRGLRKDLRQEDLAV